MDLDSFRSLIISDRSVRRFLQQEPIDRELLESLVDLTRFCHSGRNLQPLRYRIVNEPGECARVYPLLKWAGYYRDWDGPEEGKRPAAYLVQCLDTSLTNDCMCDDGLQLEALTLGARSAGLGSCIIKAFNAAELPKVLSLPEGMKPLYVVALGYPVEKVEIVEMKKEDIKYYRTPDGVHHVPKRPLSEIIID